MVVEPLESEETLLTKMRLAWRKGRNWLRYTRTRDPSDTHNDDDDDRSSSSRRLKGENHGAAHQFLFETKKQKKFYFVFAYYRKIVVQAFFCVRIYLKKKYQLERVRL